MDKPVKHKLFLGYKGILVRIPTLISERSARLGEKGARANSARLTAEDRRVHHHIVLMMMSAKEPIRPESIADQMGIGLDKVKSIIDKLENLKTFIFRSDGSGIDWAYPLSLNDTGFRLSTDTGERFFLA